MKSGSPTCKKDRTVWANLNYANVKENAEKMYKWENNSSVQSGLLTGKAWETTCKWIEDEIRKINNSSTLSDSRYYGNYGNSMSPANEGAGAVRTAGFSENWKTKNIYDLAGNLYEWTYETSGSNHLGRGGCVANYGNLCPVSYLASNILTYQERWVGFRIRLYIKTD